MVRSPADNVPKRVQMATGELLRKLPPDSGPGQDDRVRLHEGSLTRRQGYQTNGSYQVERHAAQCWCAWSGCRSLTCRQRDRLATGVQIPPTSSDKSITWNVERPSVRRDTQHGKPTARQAHGGTVVRGRKKRMPSRNGTDRAAGWLNAKSRVSYDTGESVPTSDRCSVAGKTGDPSQTGKQWTASAGAPGGDSVLWRPIDWSAARCIVRRLQFGSQRR